ncbi:AbrB/MazE/SpoVT family DNA-binding domain-containing protein [Ancylothrix sp. C2]|uniref:AbrB/MazE/SpoVT family DNA-binding domain-containing protein n=1 Tax=Ancylothrix sp. D3o TaxID=2953691 RepID=UPI0021BA7E0B|nr:AbrB/MazE/SpoVT family DNA-binding domain-containing protein [Ancylothrix sp. D3o]MCT7950547.1 AbrB/MazE/SpoVT family DNA-binding domain-containing protein [Ancylothrix sp. D3o]
MTPTTENANFETKLFPVVLQEEGQISLPAAVREHLNLSQGDRLTIIQVGRLVLLTAKPPQVPQLIDQIVDLMENEGLELSDLLAGLEDERNAIWQEQQNNA